jgi:hypothetical protein
MEHRETLSFDDLSNYIKTQPLKINMRRRVDRNHGHSLLTPPLTPSSSLRTTSIDSSNNADDAGAESQENEQEAGPVATHFLLVRISRLISLLFHAALSSHPFFKCCFP